MVMLVLSIIVALLRNRRMTRLLAAVQLVVRVLCELEYLADVSFLY
jgi:hypothetical protein